MKHEIVSEALAALAAAHPEVIDRQPKRPSEESAWSAAPPTDKTELHRSLTEDLAATAEALIACEATVTNWDDERRWDQLAGAVTAVVQTWPKVGLDLLEAVGSGHAAIDQAVVRGWTTSDPDTELVPRILRQIAALELEPILGSVTAMLGGFANSGSKPVEWYSFAESDELAKKCWDSIPPTAHSTSPSTGDYTMMAINHPAGHLEEFWVEKVGHLWRSASESWKGIPPDVADYLAELIAEEGTRSEVVKIAFCRYLDFFYRSDAEWCKQYLYPLLDWDNSSHARQAWSGFLRHGGWSNKLLADGFLEMLVPATSHTDDLDTHGQRNLPRLLAAIAIQSDIEPRSWIRGLITKSSVPNRVVWAQAIRFQIDALGPKAVEKQWERWMRDYFSDRVSSVPRTLDPTEATAMAGWIPFLTDSMPAAIDMVLQVDTAGFSLHDLFFRDLSDDRIARAPEKVAELVHHLLKSTDGQFFGGHEIQRVYEVFKSASVSSHILHKVAEEAIRLGFTLE